MGCFYHVLIATSLSCCQPLWGCHLKLFLCRCLSYMNRLHPDMQCQALTVFANHPCKETLSNPSAYFMSRLKVSSSCRPTWLKMLSWLPHIEASLAPGP